MLILLSITLVVPMNVMYNCTGWDLTDIYWNCNVPFYWSCTVSNLLLTCSHLSSLGYVDALLHVHLSNTTENHYYLSESQKVAKHAYIDTAAKCRKIYSVSIILVSFIYLTITLYIWHWVHDPSHTNLKLTWQRYDKIGACINLSSFNKLRTITKYVKGFDVTGFPTTHSI
jgi:hypothetical protein